MAQANWYAFGRLCWNTELSAAQIAETARSQGDAPDIVRDDVTKVTLFDYSDIIADEKPVYPQKQTAEE